MPADPPRAARRMARRAKRAATNRSVAPKPCTTSIDGRRADNAPRVAMAVTPSATPATTNNMSAASACMTRASCVRRTTQASFRSTVAPGASGAKSRVRAAASGASAVSPASITTMAGAEPVPSQGRSSAAVSSGSSA